MSENDRPAETATAERAAEREPERGDDHLAEVEDGCGCTEIWEHLSERRGAAEPTADD